MSIASHEDAARSAHAAWQRAVAGVLAKSRRVDTSELPADPEHLLDSTTYDAITVSPLYTALDERLEGPLPGQFPFLRGRDRYRDVNAGWKVCTRHGSVRGDGADDATTLNSQILDSLANGTSALWLTVGAGGVDPTALPEVLQGVFLELAPLTIDAQGEVKAAAAALFAVLDAADIDDRAAVDIRLGVDTLTARVGETRSIEMADALDLIRACVARDESVRATPRYD